MVERRTPNLGIAQPTFDQAPVPMPAPNYWQGNNFVLGGARPQGPNMRPFGQMRPGMMRQGLLGGGIPPHLMQQFASMMAAKGFPMGGLLGSPSPTKVTPIKLPGLFGR